MVQDSGRAERTRESEAEDFFDGSSEFCGSAFGRRKFAGAGGTREFEPGVTDLDWGRARD